MDELTYRVWYEALEKPFFAPPAEAFGIAWGIIYPLIFIAFIIAVYHLVQTRTVTQGTLAVFCTNIVCNLAFSPIQLVLKSNALSSGLIIIILGTLLYLEYRLWKESQLAFWLLIPYVLWGTYATVLQISIAIMN